MSDSTIDTAIIASYVLAFFIVLLDLLVWRP